MAEVKETINGKEYEFKFTDLTLIQYCRLRDIDFSDLQDDMVKNVLLSNNTILRAAYWVATKGETMSEFDMDDLIEQMPQEVYDRIFEAYLKSITSMSLRLSSKSVIKKK
jgi:hypothetical protein